MLQLEKKIGQRLPRPKRQRCPSLTGRPYNLSRSSLQQISCRCTDERFFMQVSVAVAAATRRPEYILNSPRAPSACAGACDSVGLPRLFPAPAVPKASRNCAAASFLEIRPRVAFSSSRLAEPDRHYYRERGLARGRFSIDGMRLGTDCATVRIRSYLALLPA